jgi:hypothetical protein
MDMHTAKGARKKKRVDALHTARAISLSRH